MTRLVTLVGLGRIGLTNDLAGTTRETVLTHAKALFRSPDFELEAAVDPDDVARADFELRYGVRAYPSLDHLPVQYGRDVVVIACPTKTHALTVQDLIHRAPSKAMLLEKPVGSNPAEAARIVALCAENDIEVFVNYHRSVLASTAAISGMISSGRIHLPYAGSALISGDRLTNGSHMVSLLIDWLGPVTDKRAVPFTGALGLELSGCRVLLSETRPSTFSVFEASLIARNGRLRFDGWNDRWWWESVVPDPLTAGYECLSEPSIEVPTGVGVFMDSVYADLARGLMGEGSRLPRLGRALEVHDALDGWV